MPRSSFRFCLLVAALLLAGYGAVARAGNPPAPAAVRALLNPNPAPAEARPHLRRVWARRAAWDTAALSRLLVYRQLALLYGQLARPDSVYRCLEQARRAGAPLASRYPVEVSDAYYDLGTYHWQGQRFDSATYYFRRAVALLEHSGYDLGSTGRTALADGTQLVVGAHLASRYANTGLACRRTGNLTAAVRYYEQMLARYREQHHEAGIRWGQCLLGEAYEEQGNVPRATVYYEQALLTIGTLPSADALNRAGQLTDLLRYYADVLLAQGRTARLLALTRQALMAEQTVQRREHGRCFLTRIAAELQLLRAEAWLGRHQPDSAAAVLTEVTTQPNHEGTTGLIALPNPADLLLTAHCLHAELAQQRRQPAAQRAALALATAAWAQITAPPRRLWAGERLANALLAAGDYAAAARVLQPLARIAETGDNRLKERDFSRLLEAAYAGLGRPDSAYYFARRHRDLNDTLRAAQQYAALADLEARHRTEQKEVQIRLIAAQARQERQQKQLAWLGALLLAGLLAGVGWALRLTRRLSRQNRQQAERLAGLDVLKTQFFSNVSHELRTPLTLVVGPVEQVLQQPDLPEAARRLLALSQRNGQRLQQLVNSLLDLTKLEAGKLILNPAPVRLSLFCRQVVDAFGPLAEQRRIRLQFRDELPPGLALFLDGPRLEQILTNLLANALKFTPPAGQVWLQAMPAEATGYWCLTVRDTGPGIAPEEQARVFERFYQSRQRRAEGGTGIGLAFSRELAELMGGTLTLESELGRGSAFRLTFPAKSVASEEVVIDDEEAPALLVIDSSFDDQPVQQARVLVVEDNPDLRAYLRQILAPRYDVLEAEDGRRALEVLRHEAVDLICSDEMMPHLSGTELLLRLKADRRWRRVPFLMVTARADAEHRFRALELGVDDYLQKPFAPRELLARTHNLLVNYRERLAFVGSEAWGAGSEEAPPVAAPPSRPRVAPERGLTAEAVASETVAAETATTVADQELLRRVREVAEAAIAETGFDTPQLVAQLGVSERTLYRKLKELTGLTPAAYLREVRLEHARQLLERRAMQTVAEVAYAVGFDNPGYFATVFLKRYGKRATEYLQ